MPYLDGVYIAHGDVSPNVPPGEREHLKRQLAAQALINGTTTKEDYDILGVVPKEPSLDSSQKHEHSHSFYPQARSHLG